MTRQASFAAFIIALTSVSRAFAADPAFDSGEREGPTLRHGSAKQDIHFNGGPGYAHDEVLGGVLVQSLTLGYRYGYFEPAIVADYGTRIFGGSYATLGMSLGAVVQTAPGPRFTLRGSIGSDSYTGVDCGLFCQSGGASATLPYASLRGGVSQVFWARGRTHFELGLEGFYGRDLGKERVRFTTTGGILSTQTESHERLLGGQRLGAVVTVGLTFDTAPPVEPGARAAFR